MFRASSPISALGSKPSGPDDERRELGSLEVRLEWETKPTGIARLSLPFQTVERINESGATRERDSGSLFGGHSGDDEARNQLIWGDNKLGPGSLGDPPQPVK
jgi:hypothetical protein